MITDQEAVLVQRLGDVWNLFLALPVEHPMDREEFCSMVHRAQEKILARSARRELKVWGAK